METNGGGAAAVDVVRLQAESEVGVGGDAGAVDRQGADNGLDPEPSGVADSAVVEELGGSFCCRF